MIELKRLSLSFCFVRSSWIIWLSRKSFCTIPSILKACSLVTNLPPILRRLIETSRRPFHLNLNDCRFNLFLQNLRTFYSLVDSDVGLTYLVSFDWLLVWSCCEWIDWRLDFPWSDENCSLMSPTSAAHYRGFSARFGYLVAKHGMV